MENQKKLREDARNATIAGRDNRNKLRAPLWTRNWLWLLAAMVIVMVAIGGATRLTGSGLSITEWKPLLGAIPPLNDAQWVGEFEKYRQTSQYELLNAGISLADFKSIYWWEWSHRQFGRLIGVVFFIPFLLLAWGWFKGRVSGQLILTLLGICVLGALQAAVGWIMVASGLEPGMIAVAPVKLMLHLIVAAFILFNLINLARSLSPLERTLISARQAVFARIILGLLFFQIALGALVAGSKAGLSYNTWPLMDGHFIPPFGDLFVVSPWYENFFDNVAMVQFQHRMTAYCLMFAVPAYAWLIKRELPGSGVARQAVLLACFVLGQSVLGIVTLLLAVPLWAGLAHQVMAMMTLAIGAYHVVSVTGMVAAIPMRGRHKPVILEMDQTFNA